MPLRLFSDSMRWCAESITNGLKLRSALRWDWWERDSEKMNSTFVHVNSTLECFASETENEIVKKDMSDSILPVPRNIMREESVRPGEIEKWLQMIKRRQLSWKCATINTGQENLELLSKIIFSHITTSTQSFWPFSGAAVCVQEWCPGPNIKF